jgi:hypothetical protein
MENLPRSFDGKAVTAVQDGDVHVHKRKLQLHTAGAAHDRDDAREPLQGLLQQVERVAVVPVARYVDFDDSVDIKPVVFGAADDGGADGDGTLRIDAALAIDKIDGERTGRNRDLAILPFVPAVGPL